MAEFNFVVKNGVTILNQLTATSTTTDTGALIVFGGAGITEDVNIGGNTAFTGTINAYSTVDILDLSLSTSTTSGALRVRGGIGAGSLFIGDNTNSISTNTGAVIVQGGIGIARSLTVGSTSTLVGDVNLGPIIANILPKSANQISIGSTSNYFADIVSQNARFLGTATVTSLYRSDGVNLLNTDEHILYVSENGNDAFDGQSEPAAFRTIKHALNVASTLTNAIGNRVCVYILAGDYVEEFPITVPQYVSVQGSGLRQVFVEPTTATNTQTAFLLNGDTTISDFTVGNFYKPGYAFKYAPNATISRRGPYVERFTVLTRGSVWNAADPFGYDANDAGGGAYLDGSSVTTASIEASMLFNEATFITPGSVGLYMTNGVRVEYLNGFNYFSEKGIFAESGATGWGGAGRTRLKLANTTGTFVAGDTLWYIDSTGTYHGGVISEVNGSYIYMNGKVTGFQEVADRTPKVVNVYGTTQVSTFERKFGTGAAYLSTASDLLELISSADLQFEGAAYCLEGFIYLTERNRKMTFFKKGSIGASTFAFYMDASNKLTGQHGGAYCTGTTSITTGTWHHIAMARDTANTVRIFLDGQLEAVTTSTANVTNGDSLTIGGDGDLGTNSMKGYIDEVRISSTPRYTANFSVPTNAFDSDLSTIVLLHCDGANGSTAFADDGLGTQIVYSTTGSSTATQIATAKQIILADYRQFGAELRSIGSAACYGQYGIYADGVGIDLKAIAYNMSYIGSGKDFSNDPTTAIQVNEIVKLNGAKVYYQTVDHLGDFRVGDQFRINQRTGNADFGTANFKLGPVSSLTISDGVNASILQPTSIQVGSLVLSSNSIETVSGNLELNPAGSLTLIESDLQVNGSITFTGDFNIPSVTESTSTTTGALTVAGGVGIGRDLYVGGNVYSLGGQPLYTPRVTLDSAPPNNNPRVGDFWIDVNSGVEYQYIQDGSNFYWIQFVSV